ncbi:MAG: hypothetical protein ACR2JE_05370 [Acidobacteriaceae bacterium]
MKINGQTNLLLLLIAIALCVIALRPFLTPATAGAASGEPYPFYIEPGTTMLRAPDGSRQVYGKVMVDLRNGKIWGFPTLTPDPYPSNPTDTKPTTSRPFLLGRFALEDTDK